MSFKQDEVSKLLDDTGRRCCLCGRQPGVSVHHIIPPDAGGSDEIDNAIPLCPNCHDEVHRRCAPGSTTRAITPDELRLHRERTMEQVKNGLGWSPDRPTRAPDAPGNDFTPGEGLSDEAKKLLHAMKTAPDGILMCHKCSTGQLVMNTRAEVVFDSSITNDNPREKAKWLGALAALLTAGWIEDPTGKGKVFSLTNAGWEAADGLALS